jgi:formylmethanofuran dehydrogenase subunit E
MDEADRAELYQEVALEAAISMARGAKPIPAQYCRECGEELAPHRREYGTCIGCQTRREARIRRDMVGV